MCAEERQDRSAVGPWDSLAEDLRTDFRVFLAGFALVAGKLDGLQLEMRMEFVRIDRRLSRLEAALLSRE